MATAALPRQRGVASKVKTSWVQEANMSLTTSIESEDTEYVNGLAAESRMFDEEFGDLCAAVDKEFGLVGSSKATSSSEAPLSEAPFDTAVEEILGLQSRHCLRARDSNVSNVSTSSPAKASVSKAPAKISLAEERTVGLQGSQGKRIADSAAGVPPSSTRRDENDVGPKDKKDERVDFRPPLLKRPKRGGAAAVSEVISNARVESTARGRPPLPNRSSRSCASVDSNAESNALRRSGRQSGSIPPSPETEKSTPSSAAGGSAMEEIAKLRAMSVLSMRVVDLRAALKKFGLTSTGLKAALQVKLKEAVDVRIVELESALSKDPGGEEIVEESQSFPSETDNSNLAPSAAERAVSSSVAPMEETGVGSQTRLSEARVSAGVSSPVRSSPKFSEEEKKAPEIRAQSQEVEQEDKEEEERSAPSAPMPFTETSAAGEVPLGGDAENDPPEAASDETHDKEERDSSAMVFEKESQPKPSLETDETDASHQPVAEPEVRHSSNKNVGGEPSGEDSSEPLSEAVSAPGCVIPVCDNIAEVIPASKPDDSPGQIEEDVRKEGEAWRDDGAGESEVQLASSPPPEASVQKGGISSGESVADSVGLGSGNGCLKVTDAVPRLEGYIGRDDGGDGEGTKLALEEGDAEKSSDETIEDAASSTSIAVSTIAKAGVDSSSNRLHPCKTPKIGGTFESSPSLPTSGSSSCTASLTKSHTAGPRESAERVRVGEKRPMSTQQPRNGERSASSVSFANVGGVAMSTGGKSVGDGGSSSGRSSKKPKVSKVSLQEQMSRLKKDYEDKKSKVGTPGGAFKTTGVAADISKTSASRSTSTAAGMAKGSLPAPPVGVDSGGGAPARVPVATAASETSPAPTLGVEASKPSASLDEVTAGECRVGTTLAKSAAAAFKKPSNLVSTMHSFLPTLVKNDNSSGAGVKKWDRLAAGAGASAPTVPALRKAQEARMVEEKRVRERADARLRLQAAAQSSVAASVGAGANAGGRADQRDVANGAMAKMAAAKPATVVKLVAQAATFSDSGDSSDTSVDRSSSHLAPLRVTGMLPKLVPDASNKGVLARQESLVQASSNKMEPMSGASGPPGTSVDASALDAGWKLGGCAAEGEAASVASTRSSLSSSVSGMSVGWEKTSVASSSAQIEMRIREQRAKIEAKRIARKERLLAEEEKKKAELESKKLREAARLEAAKRAKHEAEMKAREQKALRQAEAERRREQERVEREAREAREREDKEAKRKAWFEAKEAMEKAQKTTAALAAAKKPRILNPLPSGNASGFGGSTAAVLKPQNAAVVVSKPLAPVEKNVLPTAPAPAVAVVKPSSARIAETQASIPSSSGGTASVANGGGAGSMAVAGTINSYEMSDHDGSSSSSDSEDEEAHRRKKRKQIPYWAKGSVLSDALKKQYSLEDQLDPDAIFDQVYSCDLEAIFPVNKKRYHRRGSTANWTPDRVTPQEIIAYKRSVGIVKRIKS